MEKISVVIPTYNRANLIRRAIESAIQQTYDKIEIIIVDDGSTDKTEEVVASIGDERIIYLKLPMNQGVSYARNEGVKHATSDIIAFLDSDDSWHSKKLERQVCYWKDHPEYAMIYCPYMKHFIKEECRFPLENMDDLEGRLFSKLLMRNTIGTPTMLLKKECFVECGGFDTTFKSLEDWEFVLRFAKSYLIGYLDEVLLDVYYMDEEHISYNVGAYYESRLRMVMMYKEYLLREGLFDKVMMDIMLRAERKGITEQVQKMFSVMLRADAESFKSQV